ncbi:hypothetical protein [Caloramator sp. Dgby_cultured_2]|uniref:hypothetical protein n=1 Tax=Caloramator sp. Dgby_cultured_2 TaxID=3029174 RepID=UPI00237DFC4D|nr:hypothetical protein [Caloramator sp. Dgby_cultured_2]WDU84235.1 hypothetical protein PWK10_07935 [Caloramator sp. Dgby_cultured_2]
MYETTYDKVTDQLWKMCDTYGEEQIYQILIDIIKFRRGESILKELNEEVKL